MIARKAGTPTSATCLARSAIFNILIFLHTQVTILISKQIFDVIGQKGELWLARNQDDALKKVGWIWEKHFARFPVDEP